MNISDLHHSDTRFRLKYLLNQSDIFAHFGIGKKSVDTLGGDENKKGKKKGTDNTEDMDEDERAMFEEEQEEYDSESGSVSKHDILNRQPSIVCGGEMRPYQVEGLNWMIRLNANGINGILADEMGLGILRDIYYG